jgi:isopenicillin-N epimerase
MPSDRQADFLLDPELTFLNHGSFGACPRAVFAAQLEVRERLERDPVRFLARDLWAQLDAARLVAADFVGTSPTDFVFVRNATSAVNTVLASFAFRPGDELLLTDHGYAACRNAAEYWTSRAGARVVEARVPWPVTHEDEVVDSVLSAVSPRTRLVMLDHVTSPSALIFPIERLTRSLKERGLAVLIDGAHAPGFLPLNVQAIGADYYTGNFHKWCCAPRGAAFLAVAPAHQATLRPLIVSHGATANWPERPRTWLEFDWLGTEDPSAYLSVPAALSYVQNALAGGVAALIMHNRGLALEARSLLSERFGGTPSGPEDMVGPMAALLFPSARWPTAETLQRCLLDEHRIQVPVFQLPERTDLVVRVSANIYNSRADYERLGSVLQQLMG